MSDRYTPVRCRCGQLLLEAAFNGDLRMKCPGCKKRVLIVGTRSQGYEPAFLDAAPRRLVASATSTLGYTPPTARATP